MVMLVKLNTMKKANFNQWKFLHELHQEKFQINVSSMSLPRWKQILNVVWKLELKTPENVADL